MQSDFGRYLSLVMGEKEIIITKSGKEAGRFVPKTSAVSFLTDSLTGILKQDSDPAQAREERLREKYAAAD